MDAALPTNATASALHPASWVALALLVALMLLTALGYAPWDASSSLTSPPLAKPVPASPVVQAPQVTGTVLEAPSSGTALATITNTATTAATDSSATTPVSPLANQTSSAAMQGARSMALCDAGKASAIQFQPRSATLTAASMAVLDSLAACLARHNTRIVGHTDSIGSEDRKTQMSFSRAQAVKDYLLSKGVPAGQLTAVGVADKLPIADNDTPEGRALNRRIALDVSKLSP